MELSSTTWELASFETDAGLIPALPDAPTTLSFATDEGGAGRLSGSGGCNRYTATYTITGDRLTVGPVAATRMMCAADTMRQEQRFFEALQAVERFEPQGDELVIAYAGGTLRLTPGG
jgi:heat shock protein HslJ